MKNLPPRDLDRVAELVSMADAEAGPNGSGTRCSATPCGHVQCRCRADPARRRSACAVLGPDPGASGLPTGRAIAGSLSKEDVVERWMVAAHLNRNVFSFER